MARSSRPSHLLLVGLAILGVACWDDTRIDVPLTEVGGSGVSGTAYLKNAFCKSPCARISAKVSGMSRQGAAFELRDGRCARLGAVADTFSVSCDDPGACDDQLGLTDDVRTLKGKYAVVVANGAHAIVACGDI